MVATQVQFLFLGLTERETMSIDPRDVPYIKDAIADCQKELSMCWTEREKKVWRVRIAANEKLLQQMKD